MTMSRNRVGDELDLFAQVLAGYPETVATLQHRHQSDGRDTCQGCGAPAPCVYRRVADRATDGLDDMATGPLPPGLRSTNHARSFC